MLQMRNENHQRIPNDQAPTEIRNTKHEIRNKFEGLNIQNFPDAVLVIAELVIGFCFVFRVSDFVLLYSNF